MSDAEIKTQYRVLCPSCGPHYLTNEAYNKQMFAMNSLWKCPVCGAVSQWDDDHYDEWQEKLELEDELKTLAKDFHETYERLSVEYGWKTQESCQVAFEDLPEENQKLMLAVVREVCTPLLNKIKDLVKLC